MSAREAPAPLVSFHQWRFPDGSLWAELFRGEQDAIVVSFPGLAEFKISADGQSISSSAADGIDDGTLDHLYLNQVLPLALGRQGKFVFHGSAVELGAFAVAFIAETGRGKSTLAASFARSGARFLTDDALVLEPVDGAFFVMPGHPSIRLWSDSEKKLAGSACRAPAVSYTSKARLLAGEEFNFASNGQPLQSVYWLGHGRTNDVIIERLGPVDSLMSLARHSFLADVEDRARLAQHLDRIAEVANKVPFFHLDYPRDFAQLPRVMSAISAHAASLGSLV